MCNKKIMVKIGIVLVILLISGFIMFPQLKGHIIALAPLAVFALCPLSMLFMMKGMAGMRSSCDTPASKDTEHERK